MIYSEGVMKAMGIKRRTSFGFGNRRGYSLVEVIVAVMVLGLVVGSSIMSLRMGFSLVETSRYNTLSSQILQSEMENLRLQNWQQISSLTTGPFEMESTFKDTTARNFTTTREVLDVNPDLRRIALQVEWVAHNGSTATRRYVTYFSRNGLNDYYYRSF